MKDLEQGWWAMLSDLLTDAYPWFKALHVMAVLSWMAGLFYLPRIYVYHAERAVVGSEMDLTFRVMEDKLLRLIMRPAMLVAWGCGLLMAITPYMVDWSSGWVWIKFAGVLGMTWMHYWLAQRAKDFAAGGNVRTGRQYRWMNEVPTVLMVAIVVAVIVKPF